MSRAFVNEDLQEEAPLIPQRAPLPEGVPNYVTENGLEELRQERTLLEKEREELHGVEADREKRYKMQLIQGKIALLDARLHSARMPEVRESNDNAIRFGSTVTLRFVQENRTQTFQIVGVDEADVKKGKIAFTAPIAKTIIGKKVSEKAELDLGRTKRAMEIVEVK